MQNIRVGLVVALLLMLVMVAAEPAVAWCVDLYGYGGCEGSCGFWDIWFGSC
jgi:hypothetical protein